MGQWSVGQICSCPSCGPWETCHAEPVKGAAHPVNTLCGLQISVLLLLCVCSFADAQNTVTLPGRFTVCFNRLVLCIKNESSALSTLYYHTANLSSISEGFYHFSTERVCPLPLKLVFSISLGFLGALLHNSLFSTSYDYTSYSIFNKLTKMRPQDYSREPYEIQVSIYNTTVVFLILFVFPTRQRAIT